VHAFHFCDMVGTRLLYLFLVLFGAFWWRVKGLSAFCASPAISCGLETMEEPFFLYRPVLASPSLSMMFRHSCVCSIWFPSAFCACICFPSATILFLRRRRRRKWHFGLCSSPLFSTRRSNGGAVRRVDGACCLFTANWLLLPSLYAVRSRCCTLYADRAQRACVLFLYWYAAAACSSLLFARCLCTSHDRYSCALFFSSTCV